MVAQVSTVAFEGISVLDVDVQVQVSNGLPAFTIVGLPDKAVAESRLRPAGNRPLRQRLPGSADLGRH